MDQGELDRLMREFYSATWAEADRLVSFSPAGAAEFLRVQEIVRGYLAGPCRVLDVGGATGIHSRWLAEDGHAVTLLDPVEVQVEAARSVGTFAAVVGDARRLPFPEASFDAVLVFGPLYHLQDRSDRVLALREAARVVRPGGVVLASAISRVAAIAAEVSIPGSTPVEGLTELARDGRLTAPPPGFPGAHFHTCAELEAELADAGLAEVSSQGIEGFAVGAEYLQGAHQEVAEAMVTIARALATVPGAKDTSGHLMAVGTRPASS